MATIRPIVSFSSSLEDNYMLKPADMINDNSLLSQVLSYKIQSSKIGPNSDKIIFISIKPLQQGHLRVEGVDYKFLGVGYLLPFQNLAAYFSTFKITMETA